MKKNTTKMLTACVVQYTTHPRMKRITISLSKPALERLSQMAAAERRSRSAQLSVLIEALGTAKPTKPARAKKAAAK
jgi:metal-responsive CopG/Arc/MetJ family transcriptional regulator